MYRVVLDPVVVLRGLLNPRSLCGRLLSDYAHHYKAIFSDKTATAFILLLFHPHLVAKYPRLSRIDPQRAGRLLARAEKTSLDAVRQPANMFVAAAIAARADYLVCEDPALFALRDQIDIPVIDTRAFILLLEAESTPNHEEADSPP